MAFKVAFIGCFVSGKDYFFLFSIDLLIHILSNPNEYRDRIDEAFRLMKLRPSGTHGSPWCSTTQLGMNGATNLIVRTKAEEIYI